MDTTGADTKRSNIGGLSTALQNAVDKPLMPLYVINFSEAQGVVSGKGKTPLRKKCSVAFKSPPQQTAPSEERCCEKGCQVTSEQIKADMKATSDPSDRTKVKTCSCEVNAAGGVINASDPEPQNMDTAQSLNESPESAEEVDACTCGSRAEDFEVNAAQGQEMGPLCPHCSKNVAQEQKSLRSNSESDDGPQPSTSRSSPGESSESTLRTPHNGANRTNSGIVMDPNASPENDRIQHRCCYTHGPLTRARTRLSQVSLISDGESTPKCRKPVKRKRTADKSTSTSDPVIEDDHVQGYGYIGGLSTALQNAVDKPLMPSLSLTVEVYL
ncbi:unnamed protein product [Ranitomeya imitator]|uniref:Uncharacterized protein n=1 Tax=Ranitomeya imitator TaxID=111125 RepID=A0ABN9M3I6_9NEOB|nr:unnamed protein product [Ranitomeya imitator]